MLKNEAMLLASLIVMGMLTGSCSDENGMAIPAQPGEAIQFGVTDLKRMSRTVYEDSVTINWLKGDEIGICSTSDNVVHYIDGKEKQAKYKVDVLDADQHQGHATVVPVETNEYLKWGNQLENKATFYGAYPAERIVNYPDATSEVFRMKYHTSQVCKVVSNDNGKYLTVPDMKNAYMVAKNELMPSGDHVLLAFDPIMTTPEITITAGSYEVGTGIIQPVTVTGVSVIMPRGLKSETLNYSIPNVTFNNSAKPPHGDLIPGDVEKGAQSIFVQIDNDGRKYVDLFEGESITLTAFLPPISDLKGAKIRVHTLGAANYVLTINDNPKSQSKIRIKLPDITPETVRPNNWISLLADTTSLKSMSIPAYVCKGGDTGADFPELLQKGVRAFKLTNEMLEKDNPEVNYPLRYPYHIKEKYYEYFKKFLNENKGEFVVIWADENLKGSNNSDYKYLTNLYVWDNAKETIPRISDLRGNAVVMQEDGGYMWTIEKNKDDKKAFKLSPCITYSDKKKPADNFKMNTSDWTAHSYTNKDWNKDVYKKVVDFTEQKGNTGIVTIPNAGATLDESYGNLLLQSIIDCNSRFKGW